MSNFHPYSNVNLYRVKSFYSRKTIVSLEIICYNIYV